MSRKQKNFRQGPLCCCRCVVSTEGGEASRRSGVCCRIFVNNMLSGTQQRNLEAAWNTPVIDRIALIIAIFSKRAKSREAKLQASLLHVLTTSLLSKG